MGYLKLAGFGLLFVAHWALAGIPSGGPVAPPGYYYVESVDAGPLGSPGQQDLVNGSPSPPAPWSGIDGHLGECLLEEDSVCLDKDVEDAFRFYFMGGHVVMNFVIGSPLTPSDVMRTLYNSTGGVVATGDDWGDLPAGNYVYQLSCLGTCGDPQYFAALFDPTSDRIPLVLDVPQNAPAPGALALLLVGLAGLGFSRRRTRTT